MRAAAAAAGGRVVVGRSVLEVAARRGGRAALAVHMDAGGPVADVTVTLPVDVVQAVTRSLQLAARLAAGAAQAPGCPVWCDRSTHLVLGAEHGTDVGVFMLPRGSVDVTVHQLPDEAPTVGVFVVAKDGPEVLVDLPPAAAFRLAALLIRHDVAGLVDVAPSVAA